MLRFLHRSFFSLTVFLILFGSAYAQGSFTVQFGASPTKEEAEEKLKQLQAKNISAYLVKSVVAGKGTFFRVRAGVFPNQADAKKYGALLQQRGLITEFFVTSYEKPNVETAANLTNTKGQPAKSSTPPASATQGPTGSASQGKESPKAAQLAPNNSSTITSRSITTPPANSTVNSAVNSGTKSATSSKENLVANPANNPGLKASVDPPPAAGFSRFRDSKVGYSFEYPEHWTGQPLSDKEATEQRMNAGAMFVSQKDAAFIQAVWNELDKANNPSSENDLIVDVILKSMSSGEGMKLEETSRRMENKNGQIKTFLDLKALYQPQGQNTPIDFLGKAVIVRTQRGILLVVAFYSKDAPSNAASSADRVIASVRPPE